MRILKYLKQQFNNHKIIKYIKTKHEVFVSITIRYAAIREKLPIEYTDEKLASLEYKLKQYLLICNDSNYSNPFATIDAVEADITTFNEYTLDSALNTLKRIKDHIIQLVHENSQMQSLVYDILNCNADCPSITINLPYADNLNQQYNNLKILNASYKSVILWEKQMLDYSKKREEEVSNLKRKSKTAELLNTLIESGYIDTKCINWVVATPIDHNDIVKDGDFYVNYDSNDERHKRLFEK